MAAQRAKSTPAVKTAESIEQATATPEIVQETNEVKKPLVVKDIDPNQYVVVRNGFHGKLIYKSPRTGEQFVWDEFGGEQDIELHELRNAKNSAKTFFVNNWFMFDEDWVIDYLGVRNFYKNAVSIDQFDEIFEKDPSEIKEIVRNMSNGQRSSLIYRAKELISNEVIDSRRVVAALEESLGVDLVEK